MGTDFYALKTLEERRTWLAEENRKRCEAANARKAGGPANAGDFELDPPGR